MTVPTTPTPQPPSGFGTDVLEPLAARFLPGASQAPPPPEADGVVRAMPLVLRIERPGGAVPAATRTPLLEAAAAASLAVCLDPRAAEGGEWHDAVAEWVGARIRKISRRARGAHWAAAQEVPGVTWTVGDAQVRALVPGPVDAVPREISRLQIGGTDLDADDPAPPAPGVPVIWVDAAIGMSGGKAAAQVGHAAMLYAAAFGPPAGAAEPASAAAPFAVRFADAARWSEVLAAVARGDGVAVRDGGFTEVAPGTTTCAALKG